MIGTERKKLIKLLREILEKVKPNADEKWIRGYENAIRDADYLLFEAEHSEKESA